MDLSKPDTLCVYCGTNLEDLDKAKELLQEMVDAVRKVPEMQNMKYDDLGYRVISFLHKRRRIQPLDTAPPM